MVGCDLTDFADGPAFKVGGNDGGGTDTQWNQE
jgi:hypothetical protein